jgi:hypothetical protein
MIGSYAPRHRRELLERFCRRTPPAVPHADRRALVSDALSGYATGNGIDDGLGHDIHNPDLPAIAVDDSVIPVGHGKLITRRRGEVLHRERESKAALDRIRAEIG